MPLANSLVKKNRRLLAKRTSLVELNPQSGAAVEQHIVMNEYFLQHVGYCFELIMIMIYNSKK